MLDALTAKSEQEDVSHMSISGAELVNEKQLGDCRTVTSSSIHCATWTPSEGDKNKKD